MKAIITLFISMCIVLIAKSQTGEIQGRVYDAGNNEGIPFAPVVLMSDGMQKGIGETDESGNFTIKPLTPGTYELRVQYLGYRSVLLQEIDILADRISFRNVSMQSAIEQVNLSVQDIGDIQVQYVQVQQDVRDTNCTPVRSNAISQNAMTASADHTVASCVSVCRDSQNDPKPLMISSCRANSTVYYIDGCKVRGPLPLVSQVQEISIITGGISAKYENANYDDFSAIGESRNSIPTHAPGNCLTGVR